MTTETTIQTLAAEARKFFTKDARTDGTPFWKTTDERPDWIQDMCHEAHGDMMPDDVRYKMIVDALDALEDVDDPDDIQLEPDTYTHELTAWLASRADRFGYCDEVMEDTGGDSFPGTIELLQMGQLREKEEVLSSVRHFLETRLAELAEEEEV